jgi:hypothetical protein
METNLVNFKLRWTGSSLMFVAEPSPDGPQTFTMTGLQNQRIRFERDALAALERVGLGHWSEFPADHIQATVTRAQLWALGFKGIY